ncbi:MAG: DUF481 domain-containing protein [Candidatus Marithrix sp.]
MKKLLGTIILPSLLAITSMSVVADNNSAKKSPSLFNSSSISAGGNLGRWWLKSAKKYNPLPNPFLYHFEGTYSYSESSGNVKAEAHRGSLQLTLRKDLITSITQYGINDRETNKQIKGKDVIMKDQNFRQGFRLSLTEKLDAVVGGFWERSSTKYLEDRFVYYGGVRFMAVDSPNLDVMLGLFYAETSTTFMNSEMQSTPKYKNFPSVEDYDSNAIRLSQRLSWKMTPTVTLVGTGDYMIFLEDTDYYFWKLKTGLNFKFSKNVSFVVSYLINYDYNPFIEAVQTYLDNRRAILPANTGNVYRRDTTLSFGFKVIF